MRCHDISLYQAWRATPLGLLLAVEVHAANEHDSKYGERVIKLLKGRLVRMDKIYADGGYRGVLIGKVKNEHGYDMEITLRTDKTEDLKPLPKRWVVERSFAWLKDFRRLSKDYERRVSSSENMIYLQGKRMKKTIIHYSCFREIGA